MAGNNCLNAEKGKHQNLLPKESVCPICENGMEDLEHFLLGCKPGGEKGGGGGKGI